MFTNSLKIKLRNRKILSGNIAFLLLVILGFLTGCDKSFDNTTTNTVSNPSTTTATPLTPTQAAQQALVDDSLIKAYIVKNKLTMVKDPSGLYYQIITQGNSPTPTLTSTITVTYSANTLNGTLVDQQVVQVYALSNLIKGWQIAIPYLKPPGSMLLLLPSALAYANNTVNGLPPNSVLAFNINLISSIN